MALGKAIDSHTNPKVRNSTQIQRELIKLKSNEVPHINSNNYEEIITCKGNEERHRLIFVFLRKNKMVLDVIDICLRAWFPEIPTIKYYLGSSWLKESGKSLLGASERQLAW